MSGGKTITVLDRHNKPMGVLNNVSGSETVESLKKLLIKQIDGIKKRKIGVERIRLQAGDQKGPALTDKRKTIQEYCPEANVTLIFKDLGRQISWKAVFLIEYFGPILITALLAVFQKQIYGKSAPFTFNQKIGIAMVIFHYIKRELETLFVHRFSNDTMPFFNLFKNCTHYWFLFGFVNMYFFLHPDYTSPTWASNGIHLVFAGLFLIFEFMNLMCHIVLRNLR